MKIKNHKELATTESRKMALEIAEAGLAAIDTETVINKEIRLEKESLFIKEEEIPLKGLNRIIVAGVGKCAFDAALTLEKILGDHLTAGIAIDVKEPPEFKKIKGFKGTHPFPSEDNTKATKELVNSLKDLKENDLVIFIISGGGSTLLYLPENENCAKEAEIVQSLFKTSTPIKEVNTIRKHLSLARGGFLAKYAYPAKVISLIFSDVPNNDIQFIASGPTVKDSTTIDDAKNILSKSGVPDICDVEGKCCLVETPKEDKYFDKVKNITLVSNKIALAAMADKARKLGLEPKIVTSELTGEARDVAEKIIEELDGYPSKTALLYGGETTVTVKVKGKGGRNLEVALSALQFIKQGQTITTIASDGRDNTDYAGAICDIITKRRAEELNLDPKKYLDNNANYDFFSKAGNYLQTGNTGSNVSDLTILIKE
jgi:glycerate-2-kinase